MARTLGDAFVRVRPDMTGFGGDLNRGVDSAQRGFGSRLGGFAKTAGLALGAAGAYGAVQFTKGAISLEKDFGRTMNQIQAATNIPNKGLAGLSKLAMKMGADTVFSANDAGKAMLELARGGLSAATIKGGALQGTLTLAAAGELSMGEAANTAVKAMGQFNLKGKDMDSIAAALAGAANASSASVRDMSQALAAGGLAAHSVGFSIQETTGILAAFSNKGLEGQDAGTSLKTALDRLVPTTKSAERAMQDLGIVTEHGRNRFLKANGEYRSAAQISEVLKKSLEGRSASERKAALSTIFGSDAQRAATILSREGAAGINKMIKATSDQNAAQKQAQANMKGTAGAIETMKGSVETAQLAWGKAIKPVTKFGAELVTQIANGAVPIIEDFGRILRKNLQHIDLSGVGDALKSIDVGKVFRDISKWVKGIDWRSVSSGLGSIGDSINGINWGKFQAAFSQGTADTVSVFSVVIGFLADHLDTFAKALPFVIAGLGLYKAAQAAASVIDIARLPLVVAQIGANLSLAAANRALATEMAAQTETAVASNAVERVSMLTRLRSVVATVAVTVAQKAARLASLAWAGATRLLSAALAANPIGLVVVALIALGGALVLAYKKSDTFRRIVDAAWEKIKSAVSTAWHRFIQPALQAMVTFVMTKVVPAVKWLWTNSIKPAFTLIGNIIKLWWNNWVRPIFRLFVGFLQGVLFPVIRFLWQNVVKPYFTSIGNLIRTVWTGFIKPAFSAIKDGVGVVRDAFRNAVGAIGNIWDGLKAAARQPVEFVVNTVFAGLARAVNIIPGVNIPVPHFEAGGPVPLFAGSRRGKDSVRAMLMPDEHVWTADEVRGAGGHGTVRRLRELAKHRRLKRTGDPGWDLAMGFAGGGELSPDAIARGLRFAREQVGKPYVWGGVGPGGYDCSGFMSAVTNVIRGQYPYHRLGTSGSFPWAGFRPGYGQFSVGAFTGSPGHVAGTLGGVNVESTDGSVRMGGAARGANWSGFTRHAHLGAAGNFGGGEHWWSKFADAIGALKRVAGDIKGWFSRLTDMGGWGGIVREAASRAVSSARGWVNDKIPGPGPLPSFDRGGRARGRGQMLKNVLKPERTLSPHETETFERMVDALERHGNSGPMVQYGEVHVTDLDELLRRQRRDLSRANLLAGLPT